MDPVIVQVYCNSTHSEPSREQYNVGDEKFHFGWSRKNPPLQKLLEIQREKPNVLQQVITHYICCEKNTFKTFQDK